MELIGEYDEIEIPLVKRYVVRHRRFACRCTHCGAGIKAPAHRFWPARGLRPWPDRFESK
ncbi:MAG: hypothetical protein ACLPSW_14005 [Roseiarcus sp.]